METRNILKIALGVVGGSIVIVGGLLVYELFFWTSTTVVEQQIETGSPVEQVDKNEWEGRGDDAISVTKAKRVQGLDDVDSSFETENPTLDVVLGKESFRKDVLNYPAAQPVGWQAEWWGETKYGDHFYRVRYGLKHGAVTVGPSWVVNLKTDEARPKNLSARVAQHPREGRESEYYGKDQQVISAITSHTFESGVTLGGTLLLYFTRRTDQDDSNDILGWTIEHDRDARFDAYFQWKEGDRTTYAAFQFDYEDRALKASNLHAGEIMEVGEGFSDETAVNILPQMYDASGDQPEDRWTGKAADQYAQPKFRDKFQALGAILSRSDLIDGIEWLLTSEVDDPAAFESCKKDKRCRWIPEHLEGDTYKVIYQYKLEGQQEKTIAWKVDLESDSIDPVDRVSQLAYRVLHPRE
jgi:hypothetical protein